jgi:hypothetical protein
MRDDRGRLQDILDAIKRIERYAKRGQRVFEEDELVHTWMIHHIQIVGEAASKLTPTFRKAHPKGVPHASGDEPGLGNRLPGDTVAPVLRDGRGLKLLWERAVTGVVA